MKKLMILLIIGLIAACSPAKKEFVILDGKIDGASTESIKIYSGRTEVAEIKLNEDGTFADTLTINDVVYYTLRIGRNGASLFLKPGLKLTVNGNFAEGKNEVTFAGDLAKENEFLKLKSENSGNLNFRALYSKEEAAFAAEIDSMFKSQEETLDNFIKENKLDDQFVKLEKADILYSAATMAGMYENYYSYLTKKEDFKVSENFNDHTNGLEINKDDLIALSSYKEYLNGYVNKKAKAIFEGKEVEEKEEFNERLNIIKTEFTAPKIKAEFYFDLVKESIEDFGVKSSTDLINEFKSLYKEDDKVKKIDEVVIKFAKTDIGAVAPDFTLTNLKGEEVALSSLKGKIVVVDFWATWCGPCKVSFPGMQKAVDKFKDVEFLFVNTWERVPDKKANAEKFMNDNNYKLNVLIDGENKVVADYNVAGIPTKFLIDKEGKIKDKKVGGNSNADEIVEEIQKWIETVE